MSALLRFVPICRIILRHPLLCDFLEERLPIRKMVVMVQKEVAERMTAKPGSRIYGALSVAVQYYTKPRCEFDISPQSFLPPPAVTSTVVSMEVRTEPAVAVKDESFSLEL